MDSQDTLPAAYRPLFPWFGGKRQIAAEVWRGIGADVANYVEPFFGSGAVLFLRPGPPSIETINDADGMVANFWRAVQREPEAVAEHADNPVNECDLHARHLWLVGQRERIADELCGNPDYYDAKAAGWWCWGLCCWIGGGWCSGNGPWQSIDGVMTLGDAGQGVNRQLPHLGNAGQGVNRKLPHLGNAGQGVNRQRPHLGDAGQDRRAWLLAEIRRFADRLRNVRVCCGDWSRVCGVTPTVHQGITGVFLDPPYADTADRDPHLYSTDSLSVAHDVREWAIAHGRDKRMRIVLAGYDGEHAMPGDWRVVAWKARGGYGNQGDGNINATRERLWLSPHCLAGNAAHRTRSLFEENLHA